MSDANTEAKRLVDKARRKSRRDQFDEAIELQQQAIEIYETAFTRAVEAEESSGEISAAAHRLSEALGRLGGLHRRNNQMDEAIDSYGTGMELEQRFDLPDSYCLGNWIALQVARNPEQLEELLPNIEEAANRVGRQVKGERRGQWWAWADLGMLSLLAGRSDDADTAYDKFGATGARTVDYESTIGVLSELGSAIGQHANSAEGSETAQLVADAAAKLDREKQALIEAAESVR